MQRLAVIGAGLAGLTVALRRAQAGDRVTLFEASNRVGGQLASETKDGFLIEHGAEGFVARSEAVPSLARAVGIADHLIDQLEQRSFRFDGQGLTELAPGEAGRLLGFQVPKAALGGGIRAFRSGMGELPERLRSALGAGVELQLNCPVQSVQVRPGGVSLLDANGTRLDFERAVVATTAASAARLLDAQCGALARVLEQSETLSSLTVSLAYGRAAIAHPLDGTGFIVPEPERLAAVRAVTFSSSKFAGRAPPESVLFRAFFRPSGDELGTLSDRAWSERAERALSDAVGARGPAEWSCVSRWPHALPVFDAAHSARIAALEEAMAKLPIWLAGAAFHGSGIDAAVRSAEAVAQAVGRDD